MRMGSIKSHPKYVRMGLLANLQVRASLSITMIAANREAL